MKISIKEMRALIVLSGDGPFNFDMICHKV